MKALILVDIQRDFTKNGALEVKNGDDVVPVANELMENDFFDLIVSTQDWHPEDHGSFAFVQGTELFTLGDLNGLPQVWWPTHCVQGSNGSEFHPDLNTNKVAAIFRKGMDRSVDSYSGFFDNGKRNSTGMGEYLKGLGVTDVYIVGLALDYCIKYTALDSVDCGFNTTVVLDGCKPVNLSVEDGVKAVNEMTSVGIHVVNSDELVMIKS